MSPSTQSTAAPSEAGRLFREGKLGDAITAANAAVRKSPSDIGARVLLAELLLFAGNTDRVDVVLDACADLEPTAAVVVAEFRQLLRGEIARRQLFGEGRVPEFLGEPNAAQRLSLAALVALRGGDTAEAAKLAGQAEEARIHPSGTMGDSSFDDMRDADDMLATCFEVITTTGKYFWISPERVATLECHPVKRPRDLFWRRATMQVSDGPDGDVYLPTIYPPLQADRELGDALRLGRATDWLQIGDNGPTRGLGAVTLVVGEEPRTWLEMGALTFRPAA
ncbi:MAG: SciE type virulence protein [Alphaproteobacteria bacterium]|nr:SciE type virulence protein [Alphaproteobacteria bacterium]MBV8410753.1 SciE type virulence protein [Alphaproteobacteria bacterium]